MGFLRGRRRAYRDLSRIANVEEIFRLQENMIAWHQVYNMSSYLVQCLLAQCSMFHVSSMFHVGSMLVQLPHPISWIRSYQLADDPRFFASNLL